MRWLGPSRLIIAIAVGLVALLLGLIIWGPPFAEVTSPNTNGSPNADGIADLYNLLLSLGLVVFVGVEGCLIWFLIRYRARKGAVAAQIRGNTQLEIAWTLGAAALLIFITVATFLKLGDIKNPVASDQSAQAAGVSPGSGVPGKQAPAGESMTIRVDGQQYIWRFQYPGQEKIFSYQEMVVPVGMTVKLDITSDDVAHSWWIPKLGGKFDAIPGYTNHTWFKITKPGLYKGQCAELCGRNHADMTAQVRAVAPDQYQAWYQQQTAAIADARNQAAAERKQMQSAQGNAAPSH